VTLIALAFLLSANQSGAAVGDSFTDANFKYTVLSEEGTAGTVSVAKQSESVPSGTVAIPGSVTSGSVTYSVTSVEYNAFKDCSGLTDITIPGSVASIEGYAFRDCTSLKKIEVSQTNITYTAENGVLFTEDRTSLLCYPAGKEGEEYVIPESVTIIETGAFFSCGNLIRIVIPAGVNHINTSMILGCSNLTDIEVSRENKDYTSVDGVLFTENKASLVIYPAGKKSEMYTIPSSVSTIGFLAFDSCSHLTNIVIPNSVTAIEMGAFRYCTSLTNIVIPDKITRIDWAVFEYCTNLTSIKIPDKITSIGIAAFKNCSSLTNITIPNSVTNIGIAAFYDCSSLTNIAIPDSITDIGEGVFSYCSSLTSVTIPDSITGIGYMAFYNCGNLTNVVIGNGVSNIEGGAFRDCGSLTSVYFRGDAPEVGAEVFTSDPILYYIERTSGWTTPTWNGYRTAVWIPVEPPAVSFEVKEGKLILNYGGGSLEASSDLILWSPVEGAQEGKYEVDLPKTGKLFYRVAQ